MKTIPLPRPIQAKVTIREVTLGDIVFDPLNEDPDAPPIPVSFEFSLSENASSTGAFLSADVRVSGSVQISRAEIAAAAGSAYETLNQKKIGRFGLEVAITKLSPAAAELVAKIEAKGDAP